MSVLCLLANAWGNGSEKITIFRPNRNNVSARRMYKICDPHSMYFGNVSPQWQSNPNTKGKTCLVHTEKVLTRLSYDAVIVCGKQAREAVEELSWSQSTRDIFETMSIIYMPHPASRTLTNALCDGVKRELNALIEEGLIKTVDFIQLKGNYEVNVIKRKYKRPN